MTDEAASAPQRHPHPMLNRATEQLVRAVNTIAAMHSLDNAECETMISKALLYAIASHATPGVEEKLLSILLDYLRDGLPIAIKDVAEQRLARTAGTA
jgi:hypothetical protein